MAFKLNTVRDNNSKVFTIEKILELLGEKVNDEIRIDGKAYHISSFESLVGSSGEIQIWQIQDFVIETNNQEQFPFAENISNTQNLFLIINNLVYSYGQSNDYHIENNTLYWHGDFNIEITDKIYLKYLKTI